MARSLCPRAAFTSARVGRGSLGRRSALSPHSQYRQSNVQTLPSAGMRFIPNDTPNLRLCMGPKIGAG